MVITMTRHKKAELEKAVEEKLRQGWEFVGDGIVDISNETKNWDYDGYRPQYAGRTNVPKYYVKMKREKPISA